MTVAAAAVVLAAACSSPERAACSSRCCCRRCRGTAHCERAARRAPGEPQPSGRGQNEAGRKEAGRLHRA